MLVHTPPRNMKLRPSLVALLLFIAAAGRAFSQGPLTPPGAPGPTMKSLDELDAKLNQANAKAEKRIPISTLPFNINASGSYYLTGNLSLNSGANGITINANDVSIDLMGFTLAGAVGQTGSSVGIAAADTLRNVTVRNGFVTGWGRGLSVSATNTRLEGITARNNGANGGIVCGSACVVVDCVSSFNGGTGINVFQDGVIYRCTARENGGSGIGAGIGSVVSRCTVRRNGSVGIVVGADSTVEACAAYSSVGNNIQAGNGSLVARCVASTGDANGIAVSNDCVVLENLCTLNGTTTQAGISVSGSNNRIEGNSSTDNFNRGIVVTGSNNLVVKNTASNNVTNYNIAGTNKVGTVVSPASTGANGNSGGGLGTTDPWANFAY